MLVSSFAKPFHQKSEIVISHFFSLFYICRFREDLSCWTLPVVYSLMAASGAIKIAYDSRLDAVVAMSGPEGKVFTSDAIKEIGIPTMLMYSQQEEDNKERGPKNPSFGFSPPPNLSSRSQAETTRRFLKMPSAREGRKVKGRGTTLLHDTWVPSSITILTKMSMPFTA